MKSLRFDNEAQAAEFLKEKAAKLRVSYHPSDWPKVKEPQVIRQSKRVPNSTERRFELEYLIPMRASGEICQYRFESIRLKLANGHWYKCEWTALNAAGKLVWFEVKGGRPRQYEAGIAQIKVAATSYPEFEFWLCRYKASTWTVQKVLP
jgi:hypothetical protein